MCQILIRYFNILLLSCLLLSLQYAKSAYSDVRESAAGSADDNASVNIADKWVVPTATDIVSNTPSTNSAFNLPNAVVFKQNAAETHLEPSQLAKRSNGNGVNEEPLESPRRNYASKECGAKVIFANDEAENKNAVLNDKERDDYMRNPCERAQNKFLVVELCENIQPTMLEIANFELFSSSPKEIRFSISERYPTLEWQLIGEFEAQDNRDFQSFATLPTGAYAKFIKLELVSHHGREHYCTLSCLRVYGTSMVDEYEAEAASIETPLLIPPIQLPIPVAEQSIPPSYPVKRQPLLSQCYQCPVMQTNASLWLCHLLNADYSKSVVSTSSQAVNQPAGSFKKKFNRSKHYQQHVNITSLGGEVCSLKDTLFSNTSEPKLDGRFSTMKDDKAEEEKVMTAPKTTSLPPTAQSPDTSTPSVVSSGNVGEVPPTATNSPAPPVVIPPNNAQTLQQQVNNNQPKVVSNKANDRVVQNPLPGTSSSHKESVFMKMNKRLSVLEANMSLGNDMLITTLTEINRRYEAQKEEFVKQHERVLKGSQEHAVRNNRAIQNIQNKISVMKQNTTQMRATVVKLEAESEAWRRTANKFRLENRRLKQDIRDLQEIVAQLSRDFMQMANGRKGLETTENQQPLGTLNQPIYMP